MASEVAHEALDRVRAVRPAHQTRKYAYIDALRGYAVLLVITCHTGGMFHALPYPLKKLTNFGWHGVQLFFLMSCVTLLMSWQSDEARGRADARAFWVRRLFRIAPMYYLAGLFYFMIEPPAGGFDVVQLVSTLVFVNAWHPWLVPTVADRWMVVPGGWSIGVEVTFYVLFPFLATRLRTMRDALLFLVAALIIGCVANPLMAAWLHDGTSEVAIRNFLYFWFPNQLPVFALGAVLTFILLRLRAMPETAPPILLLRRWGTPIVLVCVAGGLIAANLPFPQSLPFAPPLFVPTLLVASLLFMGVVAVLAVTPESVFINRPICSLGQVSFSAYLLHFALLHKLPLLLPAVFDVTATDWAAIGHWFALWLVTVPATYALSLVTFRLVEEPMMKLGKRLLTRAA